MLVRRLSIDDVALAVRTITLLKPEDEREGNTPSPPHMKRLLSRPENFLIVATDGDVPVGFLLAYELDRVDRDQTMVYLYEIDVSAGYRRRGVGTQMINLLKELCRGRLVKEIWVGTWETNAAAARLYETTGAERVSGEYIEYVYPSAVLTP